MVDELKPCGSCGAPCRIEEFGGGIHVDPWTGWVCSNATLFGGGCPNHTTYLSAGDWNAAALTRTPPEVSEEMVELAYHAEQLSTYIARTKVSEKHLASARYHNNRLRAILAALKEE